MSGFRRMETMPIRDRSQPLATIARAQQKAREFREAARTHDNSANSHHFARRILSCHERIAVRGRRIRAPRRNPLVISAAPGENPILSGGVEIRRLEIGRRAPGLPPVARSERSGWPTRPSVNGHFLEFRQLWVNDSKAVRAREPNGETLARFVAWDKTNQVATISASALAGIKRPARLEMIVDQVWEIAVLRVKSIRVRRHECASSPSISRKATLNFSIRGRR